MYELQKLEFKGEIYWITWNIRCGDRAYADACSLPKLRSMLLASRMEQMSAYTCNKLTATHKRIPHHTKDALQSENLSILNFNQ